MLFSNLLKPYNEKGHFTPKILSTLKQFLQSHETVLLKRGMDPHLYLQTMKDLIDKIDQQITHPYNFSSFHKRLKKPFDYHQLGIDFIRPLIIERDSSVKGIKNIEKIRQKIDAKHNVILFANHQIEADPQVIDLMLQPIDPVLAEKMIFVAGERVIVDPLAVPFSLGCNLLCIYSKKYIDHPPENRTMKQMHNRKTMELMSQMLTKGGCLIYVALSGGRDRKNTDNIVELAQFDPNNLEMFLLMAKKAKTPTHFFPLSLATYKILPPPESTQIALGEERVTQAAPCHLYFGDEILFDQLESPIGLSKLDFRQWKTDYVYNIVKQNYLQFNVNY